MGQFLKRARFGEAAAVAGDENCAVGGGRSAGARLCAVVQSCAHQHLARMQLVREGYLHQTMHPCQHLL